MTPKEKALELCNKFMICNSYQAIVWYNAKQCALIAVDEVDLIYQKSTPKDDLYCYLPQLEYWQEVKQEIEKL